MANNPFNPERKSRLISAKKKLLKIQEIIDACTRCGMDTAGHREALRATDQTLDAILAEFLNVNPENVKSD